MTASVGQMRYDAVVFDLLSALLDSWTLWNEIAGGQEAGMCWRGAYLRHTYAAHVYRPYEALVAEAAEQIGLPARLADQLTARWDELQPWPETGEVLGELARRLPLATVTNCSEALGARAAARVGAPLAVVVTAERAGRYKPDPHPYRLALAELGIAPERALFVAGSPCDIPGAIGAGLPVVWHNRLGLDLPPDSPRPLAIYDTLRPLLGAIVGDAR